MTMSMNEHPTHPQTMAIRTKKAQRLRRVEAMLLRGVTSHSEIAAAFGVHRVTVAGWVKKIFEKWRNEKPAEIEQLKSLRRAQFEGLYFQAMSSFTKSQQEQVEVGIESIRCYSCGGHKQVEEMPGEWEDCKVCKGEGVLVNKILKRVKTTPGDSVYLRVAKEVLSELSKLDGIVAPDKTTLVSTRLLQTAHEAGGAIETKVEQLYLEAPEDTIIKALCVIEELNLVQQKRDERKKSLSIINEGKAKVEVVDDDKDEFEGHEEEQSPTDD